jgi:hypothetical protein
MFKIMNEKDKKVLLKLQELETIESYDEFKKNVKKVSPTDNILELSGVLSVFNEDLKKIDEKQEESLENIKKLIYQLKFANLNIKKLIIEKRYLQTHINNLKDDLYIKEKNEEYLEESMKKMKFATQSQIFTKYTCPVCDSGSGISKYLTEYWKNTSKDKKKNPRLLIKEMLNSIDEDERI